MNRPLIIAVSALLCATAGALANPDAASLLDRTVWVDIGPGRTLAQLSAKERATLETCKVASMSFRKTAGGLVQTFYAGLSLQTEYASLHTRAGPSGTTMLLYLPGQSRISETLHLSTDRGMLVQQTPGFRAHTYLRCAFPPEKLPRKKT